MVFACRGCEAPLTVPVARMALPVHASGSYEHALLGVLMAPGTYAVDPEPYGPPWVTWAEAGPAQAESRGLYAPVYALSYGSQGTIVLAPGDVLGTVLIPDRLDGYCYGTDGRDGPNVACARCGRPVATRIDDCSYWQAVRLDPQAVYGEDVDSQDLPMSWAMLRDVRPGLPPLEPPGFWDSRWEAAVAVALAHLLAASGGARITVPDGQIADLFRRILDAFVPPGPLNLSLALAGPGLPSAGADISLVPQHPQTGELWHEPGATRVVPLAWDVWAHLAFQRDRKPVPGGAMPDEAFRDEQLPLRPLGMFVPDGDTLLRTLARLPEVKQPWLRAIYDRLNQRPRPYPYPF